MKKGMNKDRAFLINVMWVPLFAGVMTVALSNLEVLIHILLLYSWELLAQLCVI